MTDTRVTGTDPGAVNWQHWGNAIAAIWLFISPWVLNFGASAAPAAGGNAAGEAAGGAAAAGAGSAAGMASWNAWILGIIIFLVAISNLGRMDFRQGWVNLVLGIWVFIAPWVLGFTSIGSASWDHWIVGIIVFVLSAWLVATTRGVPAGEAAARHNP